MRSTVRRSFAGKTTDTGRIVSIVVPSNCHCRMSHSQCYYERMCHGFSIVPLLTMKLASFFFNAFSVEVYPRPDGTIYICGTGGSDTVSTDALKGGAFLTDCSANEARVQAAVASFRAMASAAYQAAAPEAVVLDQSQACMRPCPPDSKPYMGAIPGFDGAYINAGHNCWGIAWAPACGLAMAELILHGRSTSLDLSPFDPSRFAPKAAQRGRKQKGVDVGEQW